MRYEIGIENINKHKYIWISNISVNNTIITHAQNKLFNA